MSRASMTRRSNKLEYTYRWQPCLGMPFLYIAVKLLIYKDSMLVTIYVFVIMYSS
jgi:hypothetical protein